MSLTGPPPLSTNPLAPVAQDLWHQARTNDDYPPGPTDGVGARRALRMQRDPLGLLLDGYEQYGPVYSLKLLGTKVVVLLGPEANHHLLVSNAANFSWRMGAMGNLFPLLGDGLLTIDGDFHRRSRKIMLPAFGKQQIAASLDVITDEIENALDQWAPGQQLDLYEWTRTLALRIAMRALFGLDPDGQVVRTTDASRLFTEALHYYSYDIPVQALRGPGTPHQRMVTARKELDEMIYAEMARRRKTGERGMDLLSLLLDATDEDGAGLSDQHIRDEAMTLLFAGHDTTTSTIAFMFFEILRRPQLVEQLRAERTLVADGGKPTAAQYMRGELGLLEQVLDETLRLFPPAWVGPRRALEPFEVCGVRVPGNAPVMYSSWASHRLPDVWEDPHEFRPERFAPEEKAKLVKGQYVPFGAGSRTCIGMRFGQLEIRVLASEMLDRFDYEIDPAYKLRVRQQPTIGPANGLPLRILAR
ncbi:MAG: cytochrome P450 [Solirubrobacteraceae bacterium]|nr:cytochrome P450 [Solirubrobacteraceae bacterium]